MDIFLSESTLIENLYMFLIPFRFGEICIYHSVFHLWSEGILQLFYFFLQSL